MTPKQLATQDFKRRSRYNTDLNPFVTSTARTDWQRGFDNAPSKIYGVDDTQSPMYQRGRAAAELLRDRT